jgi:PleD family two-component response regulator
MNQTVVVLADDLFWRTKIDHAVKSAQAPVRFLSDPAELAATDPVKVGVVIVDLGMRKVPFPAIAAFRKAAKTKGIPVVGYYEHVRKDLLEKGKEAGCDQVLPRAAFSEHLGDLVMKYALPGGVKTESDEQELPEE